MILVVSVTSAGFQYLLRSGEPGWLLFRVIFVGMIALLVVLLLIMFAGRMRARVRRMYGHCPTCGYDVHASPERCPECGTPVNGPAT